MRAHDLRVIAGLLVLSITPLFASGPLEADPHDLYEAARSHLRNGDLQAAESAIVRLRGLVAPGSPWDPDGVFAKELLPPLSAKLRRMQAAARALDAFCTDALRDRQAPATDPDRPVLPQAAEGAAIRIGELREKRDRILSDRIADPEERVALTRTASYACTERLLESDAVKRLAELPGVDSSGAAPAGAQADPLQVRIRQLKQDLMRNVAERDQLRQAAKSAEEREAALLTALADITTREGLRPPESGAGTQTLSKRFGDFLDGELQSARLRKSQTSAELAARREDLDRYRRFNDLLVQTGLGSGQGDRMAELRRAVEKTRVDDRNPTRKSGPRGFGWLPPALLGLTAGAAGSLIFIRRHRRAFPFRPLRSPAPMPAERIPRHDVDDHAA